MILVVLCTMYMLNHKGTHIYINVYRNMNILLKLIFNHICTYYMHHLDVPGSWDQWLGSMGYFTYL